MTLTIHLSNLVIAVNSVYQRLAGKNDGTCQRKSDLAAAAAVLSDSLHTRHICPCIHLHTHMLLTSVCMPGVCLITSCPCHRSIL